jgi:GNAT superfamily N-acetyltransferase
MTGDGYPFADIELARRLEYAEAHANRRFVEARARCVPSGGACWAEVTGTFAMYDGVGSPLTQTFGLGLSAPVTEEALGTLESFFARRGADIFQEVSPLADPTAVPRLTASGYQPCELTSVLFRPVPADDLAPPTAGVRVHEVHSDSADAWVRTAIAGWSEMAEAREFMADFGPVAADAADAVRFLALDRDQPIATAILSLRDDVALLAGASTVPDARGRGAQRALLVERLRYAAAHGCALAMMCAAPGTSSQRNAERSGFRIAYTRIKWHKTLVAGRSQ